MDGGSEDLLGVRVAQIEKELVARLVAKIELGEHAGARLCDDGGQVEGLQGLRALVQLLGKPLGKIQIQLDGASRVWLENLDCDALLPVLHSRGVDLGQGGRRQRLLLEVIEDFRRVGAK